MSACTALGRQAFSGILFNERVLRGLRRMSLLYDGLPLTGYQFSSPQSSALNQNGHFSNEAVSDIKVTLKELKYELAKEMGADHPYQQVSKDRAHFSKYLPKSQEELPKRSMQDSFIEAVIPLGRNQALQEKYTTFLGSVRLGRLIEDMDIFTVIVARKHILNPSVPENVFPQTLVTVLVDAIDFTEYTPKANRDIKISGHVSWVSKSTLEVVVWLEQMDKGQWRRITRALFLLAARDSTNTGASVVNRLEPASEKERLILMGGEDRKKRRMELVLDHVSKKVPNESEQKALHDLYIESTDPKDISMSNRILPPDSVWMRNTKISNVILAQPEDRNLHNKVFGGFIMRQATELSWISAYMFCKSRPRTRRVSDISFRKPIDVNSLIQMHATVVYSTGNFIQTSVFAQVYDPVSGQTSTTNAFHFTLEAPHPVPQVIPETYHEAMLFVDGQRHFHKELKVAEGVARSKL